MRKSAIFLIGAVATLASSCDDLSKIPPELIDKVVFEAAVGPYVQQKALGSSDTKVGTGVVIKLRDPNQNVGTIVVDIEMRGPAGWNNNEPVKFAHPVGVEWYVQPVSNAPVVPGTYTLIASVTNSKGSASKTITKQVVDPDLYLQLTNPIGKFYKNGLINRLSMNWGAVPKATSYYARAMDATAGTVVGEAFTKDLKANFNVVAPNTSHNYYSVLYAVNFDTTVANPTFPAQLAVSDSVGPLSAQPSAASLDSLNQNLGADRPHGFGPVIVK